MRRSPLDIVRFKKRLHHKAIQWYTENGKRVEMHVQHIIRVTIWTLQNFYSISPLVFVRSIIIAYRFFQEIKQRSSLSKKHAKIHHLQDSLIYLSSIKYVQYS